MTTENKFYIGTPIYYVNGLPHVGHFYTTVIADTIARFNRISGRKTRFSTGVDENSQKAVLIAEEKNQDIMEYLDEMAEAHKNVWDYFKIDYTDFVRTTSPRHHKVVKKVLQHCFDKGDIYQGLYEGMYCIGCESFKKDDDLIEHKGKKVCPDHLKEPDQLKEKNYFFKLSRYQTWMEEFYQANSEFVMPQFRYNEVIAFVKRGLEDFSISRETNTFGISLPFDDSQVAYVWFDALLFYYTACVESRTGDRNNENYRDESDVFPVDLHVLGKDIIRFHAIYWPAMLASYFDLGEEIEGVLHYKESDSKKLPQKILAGGFFTVDGQKMSKSIGNVIEPVAYSKQYSKELLTLYMLSAFPIGNDGDYDRKDAILTYNAKLANNFGNLLNRVVVLGGKLGGILDSNIDSDIKKVLDKYLDEFDNFMEKFLLKEALDCTFVFLDILNKYTDTTQPWKLLKTDKQKAERVLYTLAEGIRIVGLNLYSFFPEKMQELFIKIGLGDYKKELESGNIEGITFKKEKFILKQDTGILFERFELPEEGRDVLLKHLDKNINIEIKKEVSDLGLHMVSAIVEIPKVNNRRSGALKKYIKQELENIDFKNSERVSILDEAQKFYDNSGHTEAMHPSVHLQKLVENSGKLPNINNVVDSYNIESLKSGLSIGVHDISKIEGDDVIFTIATGKEEYIPLGAKEQVQVNAGEYACTDNAGERIICRMDCKQCIQTLVSKDTKKIFIYVQGNKACDVKYIESVLKQVVENLESFCGAKVVK